MITRYNKVLHSSRQRQAHMGHGFVDANLLGMESPGHSMHATPA